MKKIALLGLLALSMGFVSCDEVEESNARPQENPQLPIFEATGLNVVSAASAAETVDLAGTSNVAVGVVEFSAEFPETYHIEATVELAASEDFANVSTFEAKANDENVLIADALSVNAALREQTGLSPDAKNVNLRYAAYAVNGSTKVRIGGPDKYYGPVAAKFLPIANGLAVEPAYYLVLDNDVEHALKLDHAEGTNVYDNPVFTKSLYVTAMPFVWKVIPESSYAYAKANGWALPTTENAQFGPEYEDGTEGALIGNEAGDDSWGGISYDLAGDYIFSVNMIDLNYSFKVTFPYLYTPGSSNGWGFTSCQLLGTDDFVTYKGFVNVQDMFKFTSEGNWSAPYNLGLGSWTNDTPDADGWISGVLANGSNDNVTVSVNGLYYCKVEITSLMFHLYHVDTIGLIGDATPGGWDASTALTPSADYLVWTGDVTLGDGEIKFRANNAWTVNLGGSENDLTQDGPNIKVAAGNYNVTLDLSSLPYTCKLVKK